MKSKKVTMLAAALVVAVVAFAAVGYATTVYKAETQNGNNELDVTYVTLSQGGTAAYAKGSFIQDAYFNTVSEWDQETSKEVITYTVTGDDTPNTGNKVTISIGETSEEAYIISNGNLTLSVKDTEGEDYTLKISTTEDMSAGNLKISYYFGLLKSDGTYIWCNAAGSSVEGKTTWTIDSVPAGQDTAIPYTVVVAACGSTTTEPEASTDKIVFDFMATSN